MYICNMSPICFSGNKRSLTSLGSFGYKRQQGVTVIDASVYASDTCFLARQCYKFLWYKDVVFMTMENIDNIY